MMFDLTALPPAPAAIRAFDFLSCAVPFFIVAILAEMIWAARRAPTVYEPADTRTSLLLGLGSILAGVLSVGVIAAAAAVLYAHRVVTIPVTWWTWIGAFVLDDFNYYLFHRSAHRVRWFWASHVNHHSSQHYNLSTAFRQSWTGFFALSFVFRIWPAFVGFPPAMLLTVGGINFIYQFWIHTETIGRIPFGVEAVMNTPSHHRVHHGTNPRYLDRNYAGVFIVWDRLFRTFTAERADEPVRYGLVNQIGTFSLLYAAFHEWAAMARDLVRAPLAAKLGYLLRAPGWSHDGSRDSTDTVRARWQAGQDQAAGEDA